MRHGFHDAGDDFFRGFGLVLDYQVHHTLRAELFAVFILLFFLWHVTAAYMHRDEYTPSFALTVLGVFIVLCIPSPISKLQSLAADQLPKWRHHEDDFKDAAD